MLGGQTHSARRGGAPGRAAAAGPRGVSDRSLALAVGVAATFSLWLLSSVLKKEPVPRGDDRIYEDIAQHPFGTHTFPFGYRLGLPLLVHVLPFDHTTSFSLLAWLAAGAAAAFAFLLMRQLDSVRTVAAGLAILMSVSPPFLVVALRQGRNTDIATVFFMMVASYLIVRKRYWQLAIVLALGTVVREAVLFEAPLAYAVWAQRPVDTRAGARTLLVALPAVAAYAALRLSLHTVGETSVPGYGGSLVAERFTVIKLGLQSAFQEARRLFTTYGPLWLVSPLALREMPFARRGLALVGCALLAMTFALDWGRMILLAAPVFYPAAGFVLTRRPGWRLPTFAAMLALIVVYAVYMDVSGLTKGIIDNPPPPYPVR